MSNGTTKPIRLSNHARGYVARRGFTEAEVEETIRQGAWQRAAQGRWQTQQEFPYNAVWHGTFYATKRVRPIFVEESNEIVVVTVYTFFY